MRKHTKLNLLIDLLTSFGFEFKNYTPKSQEFTVSYLDDPNLLFVIYQDAEARKSEGIWDGEMKDTILYASYRWVEAGSSQKYGKRFLFRMDIASERYREIQYWLYDKAKEYGYILQEQKICKLYSSVMYEKGSQTFLYVREYEENDETKVYAKIVLRNTFISQPEKMLDLYKRFPDVFDDLSASCDLCAEWSRERNLPSKNLPENYVCGCHINYEFNGTVHKNCSHKSFYFHNPEIKDMPLLLDLFIIENKIKHP